MFRIQAGIYNRKYILIGLTAWCVAVFAGLWLYRSATAKAVQAIEKARKYRIETGIVETQSLARKNRTPLYYYHILKDKNKSDFVTETEKLKKDELRFVALLDIDAKVIACTDKNFINSKLPLLRNKRSINTSNNISVKEGSLLTDTDDTTIGFFKKVSPPPGTKFDTVGGVYLALSAPVINSSLSGHKRLLLFWLAGSFITVVLIVLLARNTPKALLKSGQKELTGSFIGHYQVKRPIATGGMAGVYLAVNKREKGGIETHVVIKQILPELLKEDPNYVQLFDREAQMAVKLDDHPNIVRIFDYYRKRHAIVMQYVEGENLSTILNKLNKGINVYLSIYIISEIAKGLDYAHTKTDKQTGLPLNIIHRDIKPGNILISNNGQVKIADFGIAKTVRDPEATLPETGDDTILPMIIKGTPAYMSPEQALRETVDCQSDIYSLGLVFHEILTGKQVRQSMRELSTTKAIQMIANEAIEPIRELPHGISRVINAIVMKCLEKDKKLRYQSARELHNHLKLLKKKLNILYGPSDVAKFMRQHFGGSDYTDLDKTVRDVSYRKG
ncbi:serine/threonine-protein kinase [Desulfococcaceae bacterium HSG7]|nr:serine/threonine-protein kinase [Desulfococcaceae bacterium HSG7]